MVDQDLSRTVLAADTVGCESGTPVRAGEDVIQCAVRTINDFSHRPIALAGQQVQHWSNFNQLSTFLSRQFFLTVIFLNQIINCLNQIISENKPYNLRRCTFTCHKCQEKNFYIQKICYII